MKAWGLVAAGVMATFLSGCAETWHREAGGTQANLDAAEAYCLSAATAQYPVHLETHDMPDQMVVEYVNYGDIDCDGSCTEGQTSVVTKWVSTPPETVDTNATNRITAKNVCLRADGWTYTGKDFSPFSPPLAQ